MNRCWHEGVAVLILLAATQSGVAQTAPKGFGGANLGSAQLYARVDINGSLINSASKGTLPCNENGTSCRISTSTNRYVVRFARDVSMCARIAAITVGGGMAQATTAEAPNAVEVQTRDANGSLASRDFALLVIC